MAKIKLNNVRLSFPSIFDRAKFEGKEGKFEATVLIPKDHPQAEKLRAAAKQFVKDSGKKVAGDKYCIKDGDQATYDGYEGNWSLKMANDRRPTVINKDKSPVSKDDNVLYAGCYVNVIFDFWLQDNSYGKRLNSNLMGVQFVKDGDPFGAGNEDVSDDFDDIDSDDTTDDDDGVDF
jgi:hypothetical protein